MKTIFTLFTSLIMSIAVLAAPVNVGARPKSMLTIKSFDRGDIRVVIDGRRFEPNDNYLRIQGIESGSHEIKIYRERNGGYFTIFGRRYEVVFSNCINMRPRTNLMITVDRFGRTSINESRMYGWGFGRDDRDFGDRDHRDFGDRDDRNWDKNHDFDYDRGRSQGDYDKDRDGKWDNNDRDGKRDNNDQDHHDGKYDDRDYRDNGYNNGMSDREFSQVVQSISKEWLESNKLKSATQIVTTNSLTSAQVKQLVLLFSFETNKLDLAKQAYQNTVDKKNYFMINDAFSFNGSKDELARFIRNFR